MSETLTSLDLVLKNVYEPKLESYLLKVRDSVLKKAGTKKMKLEGRYMIFAAKTGRMQAMADGAETAALPTAGNMSWLNGQFFPREHSGTVSVFQASIERAKASGGSWITVLTEMMKDGMESVRFEQEMLLHGNGTGELAYLTGACDSTSQTTLAGHQGPEGDHLLQNTAVVDLMYATDGDTVRANGVTVSAVTPTTCTLTGAPSGSGANDFFIRHGAKSQTIQGLRSIIHTDNPQCPVGTYYGNLDRTLAANAKWKGQRTSGATFSVAGTLDPAIDLHEQYVGDEAMGEIRTSAPVYRKIAATAVPELVHYTQKELKDGVEVSYQKLMYRGHDIVKDMMCWREDLYIIDWSTLFIGQTGPIKWLDTAGSILQPVAGYKQVVAYTYWNREFVCLAPYRSIALYSCLS